jgi:large subunit ribosomal protein L29
MKENADKLRALDSAELASRLSEGAETMFRLRFQMSMGQTDGIKKMRALRKERARILTIFKERGETPQASPAGAKKSKKG